MLDIDAELKNAWVRQLRENWKNANYSNFSDSMRLPNIGLISSKNTLGKWEGRIARKLSISAFLIKTCSWQYVQEVLYHEMAHQYVEEVLKISDGLPHGEAFKKVCYENGFNPEATGDIQSLINKKTDLKSKSPTHKLLDKVRKLLSLAGSSNQHEAQSAMAKAQEILLKHNLSLKEIDIERKFINRQIGSVGNRNPLKTMVGSIINAFFFVEALWVFGYDQHKNKRGHILEIYGTSENIEMAEYVHDYLHNISEVLWHDYKLKKKEKGNRHRRTFIYGLLNGFFKKLEAGFTDNESNSLIWTGDPELKKYYRRRNPKIQKRPSYYTRGCQKTYNSGINRGKDLVIHKGIHSGPSPTGKIRLLN